MKPTLRSYQLDAVEACEKAAVDGRRGLVSLPCGTGKTVAFCELIRRRGGRALVLAHRDELIGQAEDKLVAAGLDPAIIGRVQADRDETSAPVVLASVQTVSRKARLARLLDACETSPFSTVVVDESHHSPAQTYKRVINAVGGPGTLVTGWTATPNRQGVETIFGAPVFERDLIDMIAEGWLCDLRGRRIGVDLDVSQVRRSHGDFVEADLARALGEANAPGAVAKAWAEHGEERQTLVFTAGVDLAHETAQKFTTEGVAAEAIDGTMPLHDRQRILARYRAGRTTVIVNCAVLTEGVDLPETSCIVIARPTLSGLLFAQMIGRGTRLAPGKPDCLVLDVVGATDHHDLAKLDRVGNNRRPVSLGALAGIHLDDDASLLDAAFADRDRRKHFDKLLGEHDRLVAEDVGLFGRRRLRWLALPGDRATYVLPLGDRSNVVLAEDADGWVAYVVTGNETEVLGEGLHLDQATALGEREAYAGGGTHIARVDARWRNLPASDKQVAFIVSVRHVPENVARSLTRGQASDILSGLIAARQVRKLRQIGAVA